MPTLSQFEFWLFTTLCAGVGAYFGAYLKKKGENVATKEDLSDLVEQTRQLTNATKAIEGQISNEFWSKQRLWEMKRDAIFSAVGALGQADDALLSVASTYETAAKGEPENWQEMKLEDSLKYHNESNNFDQKRFEASLICGRELDFAMATASKEIRGAATKIFDGKARGYASVSKPIQAAISEILKLSRKELGIAID